jgi:hypothetical protein
MSCAPIDTDGPRFTVLTVTGYPIIQSGKTPGNARPGLSATDDRRSARRGIEGALTAAAEHCAELNAWHEREGWDE